MGRKRIELNDRIEKLSEKYMAMTGMNLDELTNKALKFYIVNQLSSHKVKRVLRKDDSESTKYADQIFQNSLEDLSSY
ncbi:hypothetical protein [Lactobacillus acetotolerans]|jgi:hypothetical protein|uniref:Uncharacterized protein n=1 Tax=Lactobacillus acetotolerans TaxID=1600 RepID=A0A0D6A544_9LACO|nr:hypothetical protein [Lactobacillus acetotolerans]KRN41755.1 hypothetical protein FC77_GL001379 [Lactobacillus acetotolerans DSM 20749 = JCM 3825]MBN7276822.1 hypothetical protein [Lactobacillus acetotolerans]QFG51902.1 hypothetical protein LA749_07930 [Lactobacillus acetotolerans]QJD72908.1 hypothetical protein HG715_02690 [Lactobacillus acetotolerans]BAQ57947.1 conserved hypothetical protein [Lactobacillus acetotolerans]